MLEAASLDGAGYWASLRHVVFPSITGILLVAFLIRAMDAVRYYDIITVTTNGGPADATKTIPFRLFETAFRFFDLGYAAAIGLMMLVVTILISKGFVALLQKKGCAMTDSVATVREKWSTRILVWGAIAMDNYRHLSAARTTSRRTSGTAWSPPSWRALLSLVFGTLAGYGLSKSTMRRKDDVAFWVISVRMAPVAAVIVPLFLMFRLAGLIDTLPGLVLAYMSFNLPFAIWLMSAFLDDISPSIEESALVAGCSRSQAFWHVVLPLTKTGLATTGSADRDRHDRGPADGAGRSGGPALARDRADPGGSDRRVTRPVPTPPSGR